MKYRKEAVTKRGEEAIITYKRNWLAAAIVSLFFAIIYTIITIVFEINRGDRESILGFLIFGIVLSASFGTFSLIYRAKKVYDPLFEGCKDIYREIEREVRDFNREAERTAKDEARKIGRRVYYTVISSNFDYNELYNLLLENEEVEYIGLPPQLSSFINKQREASNTNNSGNHNFDSHFTDEEFEDLME